MLKLRIRVSYNPVHDDYSVVAYMCNNTTWIPIFNRVLDDEAAAEDILESFTYCCPKSSIIVERFN